MFRSATFKLTVWYLALAMAISLLFSLVLFRITTRELDSGIQRESSRIMNEYPVFQDDPEFHYSVDYQASVRHILLQLIVLNGIVFVVAGVSSYALARRTLRPIEAAHEQQKRFTADVSHELRTPLTALRMESEVALLSPDTTKAELRTTIESNLEEVSKLEALINNLLRLTRLEVDSLQQSFTPVNLEDITGEAIAQLSATARNRHITIDYHRTQASTVSGDKDSLAQLVTILLENAIKYSKPKGKIAVKTSLTNKQPTITITDQGIGIEPAAMGHVFERFYRADSSRTKVSGEGYGLGLSIAKMIADLHEATITLTSQPGMGTTAVVSFPEPKKAA